MNDKYSNLKGKTATLSGWGKSEAEKHPRYLSQTTSKITMDDGDRTGMAVLRMPNTAGSGACKGDSGGNIFKVFIHNIFYQIPLNKK